MQAARSSLDSATAYAASASGNPGNLIPSLDGVEPHYGTRAAFRAAESLLTWLQGQAVGPISFGRLGGAASQELSEAQLYLGWTVAMSHRPPWSSCVHACLMYQWCCV